MRKWTGALTGLCLIAACGGGGDDRASMTSASTSDRESSGSEGTYASGGAASTSGATGASSMGAADSDYGVAAAGSTTTGSGIADVQGSTGHGSSDSTITGTGIRESVPGTTDTTVAQEGTSTIDPQGRASGSQSDTFAQSGVTAQSANEMCPADLEGLNVRVTSIPRGGALVLTVAREQVDELRTRLQRFADVHNQQHAQRSGAAHGPGLATGSIGSDDPVVGASPSASSPGATTTRGTQGAAQTAGSQSGSMASAGASQAQPQTSFEDEQALIHQASEIRVIEVPRGARLEVRFDDAARVRDLRAELREDATMLRNGQCPLSLQVES